MDFSGVPDPICIKKVNLQVTVFIRNALQNTNGFHSFVRPLHGTFNMLNTTEASDTAEITDLIQPFVTRDVFPDFLHSFSSDHFKGRSTVEAGPSQRRN
ncbi:hypothetical protein A6U90_09635 [Agrobacterium tumefaciens]|nr:hypothetical protein A6U90_09635 [Agrobacterium tumefaciens]